MLTPLKKLKKYQPVCIANFWRGVSNFAFVVGCFLIVAKIIGIYKITSPSGRIYIGQSTDIKQRFSYYKTLRCKSQTRLWTSFVKYGVDNHKFEIIEECSVDLLDGKERSYQEQFDCIGRRGLNCSLKNTKEKRLVCSDYTKKKLSIARKKRVTKQETKDKMSKALKGRKKSPEHVAKVAESLRGYKHSDEMKENLSIAKKGIRISDLQKLLQSKPVIRLSDGFVFASAMLAAKDAGLKYSCFRNKLNGQTMVNDSGYEYVHGKTKRGQRVTSPEGLRIII